MSFSSEAEVGLCRATFSRHCYTQAEAYGVLPYCNQFIASQACISTESNTLATRLSALFRRASQLSFDRMPGEGVAKRISPATKPGKLSTLQSAFDHESTDTPAHHINFVVLEEEHYRLTSFRGAFLAGGSVTDPVKRYHLELFTPHPSVSWELRALLLECSFTPRETTHKTNSITYFKQNEAIEDFLTAIGAPLAVMEIVNVKAEKDLRGNTSRRANCGVANLDKAMDTTQEQTEATYKLEERGILEELLNKLKEAIDPRVAYPELILVQLAELCEPPISKSVFNHHLRKLMEMVRT